MCDNNGKYIILSMQIQGFLFIVINYYAPDKENDQLLVLNEINQTTDELDVEQNTQTIWGGGFNISLDLQLDTDGGNPKLKAKSITKIMSMMPNYDLCDIYRARFLSSQHFTWRQKTLLKQRRLDYFLISTQLQIQTGLIDVIPSVQSDHYTIVIISSSVLYQFTDPRVKWDFLKYKIRQFAKDYATRKAKERKT